MDDFEKEFKEDFLEETTELITNAESAFLQLEENKEDLSILDKIFRLAHNLKGGSNAVGFGQIGEVTHTAETLIGKLKKKEMPVTDELVTVLLEFNDFIQLMVAGLKEDMDAQFDIGGIIAKLKSAINGELSGPSLEVNDLRETEEAIHTEKVPSPEMFEYEESVEGFSQSKNSLPGPDQVQEPSEKSTTKTGPKKSTKKDDESIRVSLSKVEKLNNLVGELIILQTVLNQRRHTNIHDDLSNKSIVQLGKISKEVHEVSMSLRMVPLKVTFNKMSRIIRDTSRVTGKKCQLKLFGEETEIDKTVLEILTDPLVHIVRNAVDHGMESDTEDRLKSGKAEQGTIEISAFYEGNSLIIEVKDDGRGIDPEVIRRKAIEKGLMQEGSRISSQEIIQYIFHPGFSTKEVVSEVSGRGVGMDVVKTNIEGIGGRIDLTSKVGSGSVLKIILPLTLAVIDGLITEVSGQKFIVPLTQVSEFVKVERSKIHVIPGSGSFINLRGEVFPIFELKDYLHSKNEKLEFSSNIILIVRHNGQPFGVCVDDILNQQQVVIKMLGNDIRDRKGYMGSSILGDGRPSLILDLAELFKGVVKRVVKDNEELKSEVESVA